MNLPKFKIRDLFVLTLVTCLAAALIADEPISLGLATVFCVISFSGIAALLVVSIGNLSRQVQLAIDNRSLRPLIARIKWLVIDAVILTWFFAAISITNFILASHVDHAPWLLLLGAVTSPLTGYKLARIFSGEKRNANENGATDETGSVGAEGKD